MSLQEQLKSELKTSMLAKDKVRVGTIRLLMAEIKQKEVDTRTELSDDEILAVLTKMVKQRKDSITAFEQGGRADLVAKETAEIAVLQAYLPQRLSPEEITATVAALVAQIDTELGRPAGPGDMGKVMAAAKARLAGQAEIGHVSAAVKQALAR